MSLRSGSGHQCESRNAVLGEKNRWEPEEVASEVASEVARNVNRPFTKWKCSNANVAEHEARGVAWRVPNLF